MPRLNVENQSSHNIPDVVDTVCKYLSEILLHKRLCNSPLCTERAFPYPTYRTPRPFPIRFKCPASSNSPTRFFTVPRGCPVAATISPTDTDP